MSPRKRVGVVGVGYVGLPLAVEAARAGHDVVAYDHQPARVQALREGRSYIQDVSSGILTRLRRRLHPTTDLQDLRGCEVLCLCVPTPLTDAKFPDVAYLLTVCEELRRLDLQGRLVILHSTTYPGTTTTLLAPACPGALVAYSPERVNPGSASPRVPRLVAGVTPAATRAAAQFLRGLRAPVVVVDTPETAEMAKLFENTFRYVNINLVNEAAMICRAKRIDPLVMLAAAYTKPYAILPHWPGLIGGHCIPVDPYYLSWMGERLQTPMPLLTAAHQVHEAYLQWVVGRYTRVAKTQQVTLLGRAYKPNVADDRESPADRLSVLLQCRGWTVARWDPMCPGRGQAATPPPLDEVILVTPHRALCRRPVYRDATLIFDLRGALRAWRDPRVVSP